MESESFSGSFAAAVFGAGKTQVGAKDPEKLSLSIDPQPCLFPIEVELDRLNHIPASFVIMFFGPERSHSRCNESHSSLTAAGLSYSISISDDWKSVNTPSEESNGDPVGLQSLNKKGRTMRGPAFLGSLFRMFPKQKAICLWIKS